MNPRLPLIAFALASTVTVFGGTQVAEAGHARVHFSGGIHVRGGVSVRSSFRFARPAWRPHRWNVGGSIYVGPRYRYQPRPYYVYYPQYVPSYYERQSYYPVAPVAAPGVVAIAPSRAPLPKLGIGLYAGGSAVEAQDGGSAHESSDLGLIGRFRLTPGLVLEGELGKMSYDDGNYDNVRVDRRLGASLLYEIGAYNKFAPYVLAGLGVQQSETAGVYETTQDFVEIGVGIRYAVSRKFHLAFDLRAGSRATVSDNAETYPAGTSARLLTPPSETSDDSEEYTRGRLSAILYF